MCRLPGKAANGRDAGRLCRGDGKIPEKRPWEASRHECRSIIQKSVTLKFIILVFALSIPFRLIGAGAEHPADRLPAQLPVSSLMAVCPMGAALILVYKEEKYAGIKSKKKSTYSALLSLEGAAVSESFPRSGHQKRIWYASILLLMPAVMFLSYGVMRLTGSALPEWRIPHRCVFFAAIGKEAG